MMLAVMIASFSASSLAITSDYSKYEVVKKTVTSSPNIAQVSRWVRVACLGARPKIKKLSEAVYVARYSCKGTVKRVKFVATIKLNKGAIMKAAQSINLAGITASPRDTLSTLKKYLLTKGGEIIQVPYSLANVTHSDSSRDLVFKAVDGSEQVTFQHLASEGYSVFELDSA